MAEFCKKCWLRLNKDLTVDDIIESKDNDYCEKCGSIGKVVAGVKPKKPTKGVEYDCLMFEVRCKQPCVENGLRITSKCPYDNYNSKPQKGVTTMAKPTTKPAAPANNGNGNGDFTPTFRKYKDMSDSEKAAFRQGAKTSENKVKERLGFSKPKN